MPTKDRERKQLYMVWYMMNRRCSNPREPSWRYYGKRGIAVCQRWRDSFEAFLQDMGPRPPGAQIDRIDNDGNYEPGNVRWISRVENQRNTRKTTHVEWNGRRYAIRELAALHGFSGDVLLQRVRYYGWPVELALATPIRRGNRLAKIQQKTV